jgi:peptide/nickel transport system substrate-binding protein
MHGEEFEFGRRPFLGGAGTTLAMLLAAARPAAAQSAQRRSTLIIAMDISDTLVLDPARVRSYTNPMPTRAAYDPLVRMTVDNYVTPQPCLATEWAYLPDGKTVRFKLRDDVRFVSGAKVTAEDVRFSFMRLLHLREQPSQYIAHVDHVAVVDDHTVDIVLNDASLPLLTIIAAPEFGITEKAVVVAHGGTDAVDANDTDTATPWLNENSAGSGAYRLVGWRRNEQVQLARNPGFWDGHPGYERVIIRHMNESAQQMLAIQHGDADVAFNLIPEQIAQLKGDPNIAIVRETSLDFMYMALAESPDNPILKQPKARQAIAYAIDYDGIIAGLAGGNAVRPTSFLPVGVNGSTEALTKEVGFREDLPRSRRLLAEVGAPDGFAFRLTYANAAFNGVKYSDVAQKLQADLGRVGIKVELAPTDAVSLASQYLGGKVQGVMASWNPVTVENQLWASGTIVRVAQRLHWDVPQEFRELVHQAGAERDPKKSADLWQQYQKQMVDFAHLIVLFQPIYQVAVRTSVAGFKVTPAGWIAELDTAHPT